MNQEDSEQNEVDEMKKGADSTDEVMHYYRAMHFSAKRGIAIACRLSVCL